MNRKKLMTILCAGVMLLSVVAGCSSKESDGKPTSSPQTTPVQTPTPPSAYSKTTGLPVAEDAVYQPIMVSIDNHPSARPQVSLMAADIVYEWCVEGNYTRLFALFNDNIPTVVGPVRSARIYYIQLQKEWDPIFVHHGYGGTKYTSSDTKVDLDATVRFFWRNSNRTSPHNSFTNLQKIWDEYAQTYDLQPDTRFTFDFQGDANGKQVKKVQLSFFGGRNDFVEYTYDATSQKLLRSQEGNAFLTREETQNSDNSHTVVKEEQVAVQNLIIQYCDYGMLDSKRRTIDLVGEGSCDFIIGGVHQTGTWKRDNLESPTVYYLSDGSMLKVVPGNTWIAIHPESKPATIEYAQ